MQITSAELERIKHFERVGSARQPDIGSKSFFARPIMQITSAEHERIKHGKRFLLNGILNYIIFNLTKFANSSPRQSDTGSKSFFCATYDANN